MGINQKRFRDHLDAEKAQVEEELAGIEKKLENKGDYTLGEGDPTIYDWEMNLVRRRDLFAKQSELNQALRRLETGQYTVCSTCSEEIEEERLELLPATTSCSRCAHRGRSGRPERRTA